ncbi:MAG: Ycf51 family protein [Phormidesmis sp.]
MLSPEQFFQATGWFAIGTLAFGALTAIAFLLKWGIRFRLVGATGFMGVLTVGLFSLSFQPLTQTVIPGAVPYNTVFDSGAAQIVITVPPSINETELKATLQQAASNLLKPSRIGGAGRATPIIRARAIVHNEGASELVYVGQVKPGSGPEPEARSPQVEIYPDQLAKINRAAS